MWLFISPSNYSEMRTKIASCVFVFSLIELFVFAQTSSSFSQILLKLSFNYTFTVAGVELYIAYLYIPVLLAVLENIFNLHDYTQRLFHIRERFEGKYMLSQYADCLGFDGVSGSETYNAYKDCPKLKKVFLSHFYSYASSVNPKIDKHYITSTLDAWCWFWIVWDSSIICILMLIMGILLPVISEIRVSSRFLIMMLVLLLASSVLEMLIMRECKKRSETEIKAVFNLDVKDEKTETTETTETIKALLKNALYHQ